MPTMTGGQALMRSLYLEGVRVIFGLPGVQLYHALDALNDVPGIRLITTRHEQATAYMADGYARASGGVGTALMVPGPGLLNASAAISTAYSASSPVLVVSGQIERDLIGADRGILHEVNDQQDCIRPYHQVRAAHDDRRGDPRGGARGFPPVDHRPAAPRRDRDAAGDHGGAGNGEPHRGRRVCPRRRFRRAGGRGGAHPGRRAAPADLGRRRRHIIRGLGGAGAPGGAVAGAGDHHRGGQGRHRRPASLALGALRLRNDPVAKEEPHFDVILGVGSRMAFPMWLDGQRVVQIDIDADELGRNWENTYGIAGDARTVMEQVDARLAETIDMGSRPSFAAETEALRQRRKESAMRPNPRSRTCRRCVPRCRRTASWCRA